MIYKSIKRNLNENSIVQTVLFVFLIGIDQYTKFLASHYLKDKSSVILLKNVLELKYIENSGAAFGIFKDKTRLFYILTVIVVVLIIYIWISVNLKLDKYAKYADKNTKSFKFKTYKKIILFNYLLAILLAGAVGNFIDRIRLSYVVDFIYFKPINFPVFNFADILVSVTAVLLVIFFLFIYKDSDNFRIFGRIPDESELS